MNIKLYDINKVVKSVVKLSAFTQQAVNKLSSSCQQTIIKLSATLLKQRITKLFNINVPSFLTKMFYKFLWEIKMFFDKINFWLWCFQAEAIGKHRRFVFLWLRWVLKLKAFIIHQISKSWSQIELCFALWSFYWAFNLWKKFWKNEFLTMLHNKILQHKFQY